MGNVGGCTSSHCVHGDTYYGVAVGGMFLDVGKVSRNSFAYRSPHQAKWMMAMISRFQFYSESEGFMEKNHQCSQLVCAVERTTFEATDMLLDSGGLL